MAQGTVSRCCQNLTAVMLMLNNQLSKKQTVGLVINLTVMALIQAADGKCSADAISDKGG